MKIVIRGNILKVFIIYILKIDELV
jgi:hypothetical protein